jgi:hypothetical protein
VKDFTSLKELVKLFENLELEFARPFQDLVAYEV